MGNGWNLPLPYQPTSLRLSNWSVMRGTAVAMMVLSRATRKIERQSASLLGEMFSGISRPWSLTMFVMVFNGEH